MSIQRGSAREEQSHCKSGYCSDSTETCKARPKLGEACSPYECPLDAYCKDGTCQPRKLPGSACDDGFISDLECLAPSFCKHGRCERLSFVCEAAQPGQTCTLLMACATNAYCDLLDDFTCKARYSAGAACETVSEVCDPKISYCDGSMTCAALKYRGEP
jgi:hypothetical protein